MNENEREELFARWRGEMAHTAKTEYAKRGITITGEQADQIAGQALAGMGGISNAELSEEGGAE